MFKKGDLVTYISDWDRKGTVTYRSAIVHSCGKKQMVLTCADSGEEMGRFFKPVRAEKGQFGTFPRLTEEQAVEYGLAAAQGLLQYERERCETILAGPSARCDSGYRAAIQKNLDALHEPRALPLATVSKLLQAAIAARG
jgi:hypothetical protein